MKSLFKLLIAAILLAASASAQSYIPTITGTACIGNGAGDLITSGTLIIVGTDQNDNPIPYRVNGAAQAITSAISRTITNGALVGSLQLANPALTSPLNVLYRISVQDNVTKRLTVYKQVIVAANSGANFDLCIMNTGPSFAPVTVVTNPGTVNGNTVQNGDLTVNGRFISTMQTITFSATPTFDCSSTAGGSFFKITLTANVTSSTLSNCSTGQRIMLEICQDATGSRTFVPPTNIQGFVTIPSTLSTCTVQFFIYDGAISKAIPDSVSASSFSNSAGLAAILSDESGTGVVCYTINCALTTPTIDTINQKAATVWALKDSAAGTRASIPSNGTSAGTLNNWNITGGSTLGGTGSTSPDTPFNRLRANRGTSLVTGDFGTLVGWGTTATVSAVTGTDGAGTVTISSSGTGQTANAQFLFTYHDGTWTTAPICVAMRGDSNAPVAGQIAAACNTTVATFVFLNGTPVAGTTYSFNFLVVGR